MKNRFCVKILALSFMLSASAAFAQSTKSVITGIKAESTSENSITVTWASPADISTVSALLVYRATKPFTGFSQIEKLEPIAVLRSNELSYTDILRTSQVYYYAVVSALGSKNSSESELYFDEETDMQDEYSPDDPVLRTVLPGVNATVQGARASKQKKVKSSIKTAAKAERTYENGAMRETPLPYIDVLDELPAHEPKISAESKNKAKTLIRKNTKQKPEPLPIHIFEEDLVSPAGGDDYLLFEILKTYFIKKQYSESITQLRKFLAQNRTKSVADRASFYLGESYYYTGNFPSALTRFLALEETYPELSRQWIDSTLDQLN
ncbi:hypothetical protein [Treponema sp.]|uniref:tetratricopeptide repeat protein n=1 Tax=Treponema sp. TaxID=166 RepID=UPI00298E4F74|nr:hypothetical protein [Treponema sp.]MCQ2241093.1 hypothetical protein [Treponema sp.]